MKMHPAIRRLAEQASQGVLLRRRLPRTLGGASILVSPESMLRFWRLDLEKVDPPLFAVARRFVRSGDVVWDIGANVGLFSFAASWMGGTRGSVFAFEPDIWLSNMIHRSAATLPHGYAPVHVVTVGLSNHVDLGRLTIGTMGRAANHLDGNLAHFDDHDSAIVPMFTLDWLFRRLPSPAVVKIDVEGAENTVLEGARRLLSEIRPVIICEVSQQNSERVASILHKSGYTLFDLDLSAAMRLAPFNTIALPSEHRDSRAFATALSGPAG